MTKTTTARSASSLRLSRDVNATESRRWVHDRVLDGIRKFLEDHAMHGKTGSRSPRTRSPTCPGTRQAR